MSAARMKSGFREWIIIVAVTCLCLAHAAEPLTAKQRRLAGSDYERGFELFTGYDAIASKRMSGWKLMVQAAEAGDPDAITHVADYAAGFLTVNAPEDGGDFFKPNLELALKLYRNAVDAGDQTAKTHLALLYSSGIGAPRHVSETPQALLLAAAKAGDQEAMLLLSERYLYGHGVQRNLLEAARWQFEGRKNDGGDSHFIDDQAQPKTQDSALLDQFARVYALYVQSQTNAAAKVKLEQMVGTTRP